MNTTTTVMGTLVGYQDDRSPCSTVALADHVYALTPPANASLVITVRGATSTPRVSLTGPAVSAALCPQENALVCDSPSGSNASTLQFIEPATGGTYHLYVEGTADDYTLEVLTMEAAAGDTCATVLPLDLSTGVVTVYGTTVNAQADFSAPSLPGVNCQAATMTSTAGRDRVYALTFTSPQLVTATLTSLTSSFFPSMLWSQTGSGCAGPIQQCLLNDQVGQMTAALSLTLLPGTTYLWIDSTTTLSGDYRLRVTSTPAGTLGESCASPVMLTPDSTPTTVTGTTVNRTNNDTPVCGSSLSLADAVYGFTVADAGQFNATVTSTSPGYAPVLTLRGSCLASPGTLVQCAAATSTTATINHALSPGAYFLWVDGAGSWDGGGTMPSDAGVNGTYSLTFSYQ
jgi:hypothetical protein